MAHLENILIFICVYALLAQGMNLVLGYTGLLNLGQVGFYVTGAYATALMAKAGVPVMFSFLLAGSVTTIMALLIGIATLRLRGHYFAIASLGFGEIIRAIVLNWEAVTRGALGIPGIPSIHLFGWTLDRPAHYLPFALGVALLGMIVMYRIVRAPFGRVLEAIREDEVAATALGINTFRYKLQALLVAAFFSGIAGALYAYYVSIVDPFSFGMHEAVLMVLMVVLGGMGNFWGSIVGTVVLFILPEPLRFLPMPVEMIGPLRQLLYALLLIGIMLYRPQGILPRTRELSREIKN